MPTKDENESPVTLPQLKLELSTLKLDLLQEVSRQFVRFYNDLIEPRFQRVDERFDRIEVRLDEHDCRFDDLYKKFEVLHQEYIISNEQIRRLNS